MDTEHATPEGFERGRLRESLTRSERRTTTGIPGTPTGEPSGPGLRFAGTDVTLLSGDPVDVETFNIGSANDDQTLILGEGRRNHATLEQVRQVTDRRDGELVHFDSTTGGDSLGDDPTRTVREGIVGVTVGYRENRSWYQPPVRS